MVTSVNVVVEPGIVHGIEQLAEGRPIGRDQVLAGAAEHPTSQPRPPVGAAGQQAVAGRRAHRAGRVGVEKGEPLIGHLLQPWRLDPAVGIGGREIADADVVGHHEDHVRAAVRSPDHLREPRMAI